jgi:thiosulfate dehydrogenase [quinone] large subunit
LAAREISGPEAKPQPKIGLPILSHVTPAHLWAALRLFMAWTFLWAFFDKLLGLGFATEVGWLDGGDPTFGYLTFQTSGPLDGLYGRLAGQWFTNVLFMAGLLGVGFSMLLGIGVVIGGLSGALMYLLMWSAHVPPETNPLTDDHILGALVMVGLAVADAGVMWGLGRWWQQTEFVRRFPLLR